VHDLQNTAANRTSFRVALVVDDDAALLNAVARTLSRSGIPEVRRAHDLSEARAHLDESVDLLVCDLCLGRDSGVEVFALAARLTAPPAMIAMTGHAARSVVFDLACSGVLAFLEKPFTPADLEQRIADVATMAPQLLRRLARAYVGRYGAREAQRLVRYAMFQEALERTEGNRHAAARLLGVDRRAVQLMAAELAREPIESEVSVTGVRAIVPDEPTRPAFGTQRPYCELIAPRLLTTKGTT
jgi:DNA-binding NtrC family response regulator